MSRSQFSIGVIAVCVAVTLNGCGSGDSDTNVVNPVPETTAKAACEALTGRVIEGGEVVSAQLVAATTAGAPEHCAITGRIAGSSINFAARLPSNWNEKAVMGASYGFQGSLDIGYAPEGNPLPLTKGYVEYITDTGHEGTTYDSSFATQPEALANFNGLSHQRTTEAVKGIIKEYFGRAPQRTYFEGCSGGGHVALVMAQRHPGLFDGIIAGAPGGNWIGTWLGWQRPARALVLPGAVLSQAKLATLSKAVLAQCDKVDGIEDGVVSRPLACSFDPEPLRCTGTDNDNCLTGPQINVIKEYTSDTRFSDGSLLVKGSRLVGNEDDPNNLAYWATPDGGPAPFKTALAAMVGFLTRNPNADPLTYSIPDDELNIRDLGNLMDTWPGNLSAFGARGGKLIIWNGTADTPVPFENQILYYDGAVASLGGAANAQQTVRAYFPPGVSHCGGGAGADRFDYLNALDRWVTMNEPPDGKEITKVINGSKAYSRPLCAYPTWPQYKGTGDPNAAASFSCVAGP